MGNVESIVSEIRRKIPTWQLKLASERHGLDTLAFGIALKSAIFFELLVQESVRCLLQVFPDRWKYNFTWRNPAQAGSGNKRCLAENIALLNLLQEDLGDLLRQGAFDPEMSALMNQLRKARNALVHPQPRCARTGDLQEVSTSVPRLIDFLENLRDLCGSTLMSAILTVERKIGAYDDLPRNLEYLPDRLREDPF